MSPRFACGLIVGKFAPLHRGHELLIRRAIADCDTVCILSWSKPEPPGCGPELRAKWLERLFPGTRRLVLTDTLLAGLTPPAEFAALPDNDSDPVIQRRLCAWLCERVWNLQPDAVFTSESYGAPLAREMTACFRVRNPSHPGVAAVDVDPTRNTIPVSGSMLRADIHAHRRWLSPEVYQDFVGRVVLLGGESTGKSTLAAALAERLGSLHVAEYGRELWEQRGGNLGYEDMLHIAREQIAREQAALGNAHRWLVCDTSPLTTLFYSLSLFGEAVPELRNLAGRDYDATILCAPDFPFVQDGTRCDDAFRIRQDVWYRAELAERNIPFHHASGSFEQRLRFLEDLLA